MRQNPIDVTSPLGGRVGMLFALAVGGACIYLLNQWASEDTSERLRVSVLSDSHAYNEGSWFRLSVEAGKVPGTTMGTMASYPGASTTGIREGLPEIVGSDVVIVQAGTNNLLGAQQPGQTASEVADLVKDAQARAGQVVLALVPPSDDQPDKAAEVNAALNTWAQAEGVPVLDLYSPVAAEDGSWRDGLSSDGVHANEEGSRIMARVTIRKLSALIDA